MASKDLTDHQSSPANSASGSQPGIIPSARQWGQLRIQEKTLTLVLKAELKLKEIIVSNISVFNSSKQQALPIGSFPCIEQKESISGRTQKYLKNMPGVKLVLCRHGSCQSAANFGNWCRETEGTGRDSAFIPSRKFKSRRSQEATGWIGSGPLFLPDVSWDNILNSRKCFSWGQLLRSIRNCSGQFLVLSKKRNIPVQVQVFIQGTHCITWGI